MSTDSCFDQLIQAFADRPEVDAILLAGSRGAGCADGDSDYDLYLYLNQPLPVAVRREITADYCESMELNNTFWETEDDGVLKSGSEIELIYRSLDWLEEELSAVVEHFRAAIGYTTCFWANLLDSEILFDRDGQAAALQKRFQVAYPPELKQAIINKNFPLLMQQMPAYYFQLKKALRRGDRISVHHRTTELLASYFDILFALNEMPHPGEKRLLPALDRMAHCPAEAVQDISVLLSQAGRGDPSLLKTVERLTQNLKRLIEKIGQQNGLSVPQPVH